MSLTEAYLIAMSWGAAAALLVFACCRRSRKRSLAEKGLRSSCCRETVQALFWMFCGGMAVVTLTPRWLVELVRSGAWNAAEPFFAWGSINAFPFATFAADAHSLYILAGNIVMFLPFGFFPALLWRAFDGKHALLTGLLVTGFIECWQLAVGRTWDIDDLLLNTIGTLTGFLLWKLADRVLPNGLRQLHCTETESEIG